jgi:hypothetical protein
MLVLAVPAPNWATAAVFGQLEGHSAAAAAAAWANAA